MKPLNFEINRLIVYWIVIVILEAINLLYLFHTFFSDGTLSFRTCSINAAAEALILFFPFIFVRRKYVYFALLWFFVISVIIFCNILYFRNFSDAISSSTFVASGIINDFVISSALASLKFTDSVFILTSIIAIAATIWVSRSTQKVTGKFLYIYAGITLCLAVCQFGLTIRRIMLFNKVEISESFKDYASDFELRVDWKSYMMDYGFTGYSIRVIKDFFHPGYEISDKEIIEVIEILDKNSRLVQSDSIAVSKMRNNYDKNLILIIVESLNSRIFDLEDLGKIAPELKRISEDSATVFIPNIESMVSLGRSSDAQFTINTGILPLRNEAFVSRYADADYPSLAKILGLYSVEVIGENKTLWSHHLTTKSYGFDRLVDNTVPKDTRIASQDSLIFAVARKEISKIKQPFFMQITTLGMHRPYLNETGENINLNNDYSAEDHHYLEAVHSFDRSCNDFLEFLKETKIYDNSVIVIVSDYEESYPNLSRQFNEKRIPMLVLNSSLNQKTDYLQHFRQIDIFPTILDLMGRTDSVGYRGFGKSIFRSAAADVISTDKGYDISEKLIKSKELRDSVNHSLRPDF